MNDAPSLNLPFIPETITVHLGAPTEDAGNITVDFPSYIKNSASSEIYPTWPDSSLRANIYAIISFALNRVYTQYYPSRGYDFDITNSTAFDQSFVPGRDIFENIGEIVDEIFNSYVRRVGTVEPYFTQYCNGTTVTCGGLSQWGTVELANQGYSPIEILRYYYGDNIEIVVDVPVMGTEDLTPGVILRFGSTGNEVTQIQMRLNRISKNYPAIPKISPVDGIFAEETDAAVRAFQSIFNLTVDGLVGNATWYAIQRVYAAVKRLNDLASEGLTPEEVTNLFTQTLMEGSRGRGVYELQYFLNFIANYNASVPYIETGAVRSARDRRRRRRDVGLHIPRVPRHYRIAAIRLFRRRDAPVPGLSAADRDARRACAVFAGISAPHRDCISRYPVAGGDGYVRYDDARRRRGYTGAVRTRRDRRRFKRHMEHDRVAVPRYLRRGAGLRHAVAGRDAI